MVEESLSREIRQGRWLVVRQERQIYIKTAGMAGPRRLRRGTRTARRETGVLSLGTDTLGYDDVAEDEETDRYRGR